MGGARGRGFRQRNPPEILARIWDPFFTTKPAGKGTGLGLATVRGIMANHHGFITLESTLGRGTRFQAYFPAAESALATTSELPGTESNRGRGDEAGTQPQEPAAGS